MMILSGVPLSKGGTLPHPCAGDAMNESPDQTPAADPPGFEPEQVPEAPSFEEAAQALAWLVLAEADAKRIPPATAEALVNALRALVNAGTREMQKATALVQAVGSAALAGGVLQATLYELESKYARPSRRFDRDAIGRAASAGN